MCHSSCHERFFIDTDKIRTRLPVGHRKYLETNIDLERPSSFYNKSFLQLNRNSVTKDGIQYYEKIKGRDTSSIVRVDIV